MGIYSVLDLVKRYVNGTGNYTFTAREIFDYSDGVEFHMKSTQQISSAFRAYKEIEYIKKVPRDWRGGQVSLYKYVGDE